jgi:hypothetical protein
MENLKGWLAENLAALKPYLITAGAAFAFGLICGLWI